MKPVSREARIPGDRKWRTAAWAVAAFAALFSVWVNLAVGIVGSEDNPINRVFFAAPALVIAGALAARFRSKGMSACMFAVAAVQAGLGVFAAAAHPDPASPTAEIFGVAGLLAGLFLAAAWLFRKAAHANRTGFAA